MRVNVILQCLQQLRCDLKTAETPLVTEVAGTGNTAVLRGLWSSLTETLNFR